MEKIFLRVIHNLTFINFLYIFLDSCFALIATSACCFHLNFLRIILIFASPHSFTHKYAHMYTFNLRRILCGNILLTQPLHTAAQMYNLICFSFEFSPTLFAIPTYYFIIFTFVCLLLYSVCHWLLFFPLTFLLIQAKSTKLTQKPILRTKCACAPKRRLR